MFLPSNGPIDLSHTLHSGQAFRWRNTGELFEGVMQGVWFRVWQAPGGVAFESAPQPPETTAPLLRSYLRLDDDLPALYERLCCDPRLEAAVAQYPGLRLLHQDPWECLVCFVISAYSNIKRITGHVEEICRRYGDPISLPHETVCTFPSPQRLAEVGEQQFRSLGLGYRAKYLARLPHQVLDHGLDLRALRTRPYAEARAALLALDGVGEKVADCVLAFSLDRGEAFPVDVWVRRAVREWYYRRRRVTDRTVRLWAARKFGTDAAYAQQYLFHQRRLEGTPKRKPSKSGDSKL